MDGAPKGGLGIRSQLLKLLDITLQVLYVGVDVKDTQQRHRARTVGVNVQVENGGAGFAMRRLSRGRG